VSCYKNLTHVTQLEETTPTSTVCLQRRLLTTLTL